MVDRWWWWWGLCGRLREVRNWFIILQREQELALLDWFVKVFWLGWKPVSFKVKQSWKDSPQETDRWAPDGHGPEEWCPTVVGAHYFSAPQTITPSASGKKWLNVASVNEEKKKNDATDLEISSSTAAAAAVCTQIWHLSLCLWNSLPLTADVFTFSCQVHLDAVKKKNSKSEPGPFFLLENLQLRANGLYRCVICEDPGEAGLSERWWWISRISVGGRWNALMD